MRISRTHAECAGGRTAWSGVDQGLAASMGFLAQMIRWNVQYDHKIRRDHQYLGCVRLGLGQGEGPIIYGLVE